MCLGIDTSKRAGILQELILSITGFGIRVEVFGKYQRQIRLAYYLYFKVADNLWH
jgi:hypothetical protein